MQETHQHAFSWNATYDAAQVAVEGPYRTFERGSDDGGWVRDHFCGTCGVSVFYEIEVRPGMISIPAGAFADHDRVRFPPGNRGRAGGTTCPIISRRRRSKSTRSAAARG